MTELRETSWDNWSKIIRDKGLPQKARDRIILEVKPMLEATLDSIYAAWPILESTSFWLGVASNLGTVAPRLKATMTRLNVDDVVSGLMK
jgi:hypothetical protein